MTRRPTFTQQTEAPPARQLESGGLRTLYMDLFGRPPFQAEREAWLGRGRHEWLEVMLGTQPFWRHWLDEQLYYFFLIDNFRPETQRMVELPAKLSEGRSNVREAVHRIGLSSSFELRNPGADTFVTVVMEQIVGLKVQNHRRELEIGKSLYDGKPGLFLGRSGATQADLVDIAVQDKRFSRNFIEREFGRLLHAEPGKSALTAWSRSLHKDPRCYVELVREWLLSEGYDTRLANPVSQPNRLFIKALYVDLTDRLPSDEEAEPLREALDGLADSRPLRSILVRLFLDSGRAELPTRDEIHEPELWITELFERLLGRPPSESELAVFVSALSNPAGRPETVLYAILSSPEYHRY